MAEFSIAALFFSVAAFGVVEVSRLVWVHNALTDATRVGVRYAAISAQNSDNVKNMVVYGKTSPGNSDKPVVPNLVTDNVQVTYTSFGVKQGTVTVAITGYQFTLTIPLIQTSVTMPAYKTTLTAESAGQIPLAL